MRQVIIIHGGKTFATYEKYIDYLSTKEVKQDRLQPSRSWKNSLQGKLGNEFIVLCPSMPNSTNAQYSEWKIYFDRIRQIITDDCIVIGHSLGGVFLAKYLSENTFSKRIAGTILIAAPFDDESTEDLTDFKLAKIPTLFNQQAGRVVFFNGKDDPVVPITELDKYRRELPDAEYNVLSAPDHFVRPEFPEIVEFIKSIH